MNLHSNHSQGLSNKIVLKKSLSVSFFKKKSAVKRD